LDCETTSLTPDYLKRSGVIWELALIERDRGAERLYRLAPPVELADEKALEVGRYRERTAEMRNGPGGRGTGVYDLAHDPDCRFWSKGWALAPYVSQLLQDATLIAANPTFDAGFLTAFLAAYGFEPKWHYRLRDIGSMAWAWLQAHHLPHHLPTPAMDASTDEFAQALGVVPELFDRHTALGDCRLVAAMLDVMEGGA
jgi:hypothetical protein